MWVAGLWMLDVVSKDLSQATLVYRYDLLLILATLFTQLIYLYKTGMTLCISTRVDPIIQALIG